MRYGTFALAFAVTLAALPQIARANGRFPAANQLVVSPADPGHMVLRTTFGILVTSDKGQNWDWLCELGIGYGGTEDPSMGITTAETLLAGTFEGLSQSTDKGCSWGFVPGPLTQNVVVDLTVRPDAPSSALTLTNKFSNTDDAGGTLFNSTVFGTTDDGKTWAPIGPALDPTIVFETVEVAKSDPTRIYVSGVRGDGATEQGVVLVSKDTGQTWKEYKVPLDVSTERAPYVSAVDPSNADRVYVRTKGSAGSRLLVSDDGAQTFREVLKLTGDMLGFAISPDGQKIYAGGAKDGLLVATSSALTFTKKSPIAVQCLTANGTTLYACSNEVSGFILGASQDDGATFAPMLHLYGVRGPLACGPSTSEAQCQPLWPPLRDSLGTAPADGGADASSGGNDGGSSSGGTGKSSCSCGEASGAGEGAMGMGAVGLAVGLMLRRKRRAR